MGVVGQDANRVVSEFQRVRIGEQEKRWCLLLGGAAEAAGLVDEVITVFLKHLAGWTADGDAEEGEALLGGEDAGLCTELLRTHARAVDAEM